MPIGHFFSLQSSNFHAEKMKIELSDCVLRIVAFRIRIWMNELDALLCLVSSSMEFMGQVNVAAASVTNFTL